jgi:hypothetical protein
MAKLLGDGVLIVWVDLKAEARRDADRWYVEEHLPERVAQAQYLRARRFQAVAEGLASPRYMAVFEAQTPAALAGEGYRRITSKINPRSQTMRNAFTRCIRSTHRRLACFGEGEGGVMLSARLRFDSEADRARYDAWSRDCFAAWLTSHEAVISGHALAGAPEVRERMDQFRQTGQGDERADGVLLVELGQDADADAALLRMLSVSGLADAGVATSAVDTGIYRSMVSFSAA